MVQSFQKPMAVGYPVESREKGNSKTVGKKRTKKKKTKKNKNKRRREKKKKSKKNQTLGPSIIRRENCGSRTKRICLKIKKWTKSKTLPKTYF
jgi:hypothetical protein